MEAGGRGGLVGGGGGGGGACIVDLCWGRRQGWGGMFVSWLTIFVAAEIVGGQCEIFPAPPRAIASPTLVTTTTTTPGSWQVEVDGIWG